MCFILFPADYESCRQKDTLDERMSCDSHRACRQKDKVYWANEIRCVYSNIFLFL